MQSGGCPSIKDVAISIHGAGIFPELSFKGVIDAIKSLVDAGCKYDLIERILGLGSLFVLSEDISDTVYVLMTCGIGRLIDVLSWERCLGKMTDAMKNVISHLQQVGVPARVKPYEALCCAVLPSWWSYLDVLTSASFLPPP